MSNDDDSKPNQDLNALGVLWAESVSEDLSGLFGVEVSVSGPAIDEGGRDALLGNKGCVVCSSCGERVFVSTPLRGALVLAAAQMGKPAADFGAFQQAALEGEVLQAYRSALDICVGIFGRVLDEEAGLPALKLGDTERVELPGPIAPIDEGSYRRARFRLEIAGFPRESIDFLVESRGAREWFGDAAGGGAEAGGIDAGPIALIDPDAESREAFAALADALGRDVLTLDPAELGDETMEELAETSSVILSWDLGGLPGLDVLEKLRRDETTAGLRVALASDRPTRAMVDSALRWGAHTFLFQPWDASEISERLLR